MIGGTMEKVVIPLREEFKPAEAGRRVRRSRQYIYACMQEGKLPWALDYEGHRVILRKDLVEFAIKFLKLTIDQGSA